MLTETRIADLATVSPDRIPHVVPRWFRYEDERFLFSASSTSRRADNIAERVTARVLVEASVIPDSLEEILGWLVLVEPRSPSA